MAELFYNKVAFQSHENGTNKMLRNGKRKKKEKIKRKEEIRKGERWQGKHNTKIRCKDVASWERL